MPDEPAPAPARDWRDEKAYRELESLDRRGFAWEYLRRNPDYRRQNKQGSKAAARTVAGIPVLRTSAVTIPPVWGLRFRRITGRERIIRENILG